jgi:hypothetical protein
MRMHWPKDQSASIIEFLALSQKPSFLRGARLLHKSDFCAAEKVKGAATAASEKSCRRRGHHLAAVNDPGCVKTKSDLVVMPSGRRLGSIAQAWI